MLGIFETAQIAHDGLRKKEKLSEAVVLALVTGRLKYDRRGEDTIKANAPVSTLHIGASRRIYPPCCGLVEVCAFSAPSQSHQSVK